MGLISRVSSRTYSLIFRNPNTTTKKINMQLTGTFVILASAISSISAMTLDSMGRKCGYRYCKSGQYCTKWQAYKGCHNKKPAGGFCKDSGMECISGYCNWGQKKCYA